LYICRWRSRNRPLIYGGKNMSKITKEKYEFALARIEELLPMVDDNTPANDRNAVELTMMSDVVIEYEKEHYPIAKPTVAQLIQLSLDEKNITPAAMLGC